MVNHRRNAHFGERLLKGRLPKKNMQTKALSAAVYLCPNNALRPLEGGQQHEPTSA
jgi:hypothetical protein